MQKGLILLCCLLWTQFGFSAIHTVTTMGASGAGSLPGVVTAALSSDTIVFHQGLIGDTIVLSATIDIDKDLTIIGPGHDSLIITLPTKTSVAFNVLAGYTLNVSGLTIANARAFEVLGTFYGNDLHCRGAGEGGALVIGNGGRFFLEHSWVTANRDSNLFPSYGGLSGYEGNMVMLDDVVFAHNFAEEGGAINSFYNDTLIIRNCRFVNNTATFEAAAINSANDGVVEIVNTIIDSNRTIDIASGAGLYISGTTESLLIKNCTFSNNYAHSAGGAMYLTKTHAANTRIEHCSFVGNVAGFSGGALAMLAAEIDITNCTFSGNTAGGTTAIGGGGGIYLDAAMVANISNSTIAYNHGVHGAGGIVTIDGTVRLQNCIVAANSSDSVVVDLQQKDQSHIVSLGYNLIGDTSYAGAIAYLPSDIVGNSSNPLDAMLAPLDYYGGPTPIHGLLCGSIAIDTGNDTVTSVDQRGLGRYGLPDRGAFEQQLDEAIPPIDLGPDIFWMGSAISLQAGTHTDSVNWYSISGDLLLADSTMFTFNPVAPTSLVAELYNRFQCSATDTIFIDMEVGITDASLPADMLNIYPNPTSGSVTISYASIRQDDISIISIINALGQLVHQVEVKLGDTITLNLDVDAGIYFIMLETQQGKVVRKLLVE